MAKSKKRRFRPFSFVWTVFLGISTFIGALILIALIVGGIASSHVVKEKKLPEQMILTVQLKDGLIEQESTKDVLSVIENFGQTQLTVQDLIGIVDKAARDGRVKGLAVNIVGGDYGVANVQELRAALKRFRAAGKPAWVYSPSYEEAGGTMGAYYLASAFDQIWMQPVGAVALPGFDAEMPFFLEALQRIGVTPQFFQRKEYKSVMENLARKDMSPQNREMTSSLLTDITAVIVGDIAIDRKLLPQQVSADIDTAVFTDQEALQARLVDHIDYPEAMIAALRQSAGGNAVGTVDFADYEDDSDARLTDDHGNANPKVGFITAIGEIAADGNGGLGKTNVTPQDIVDAFDDAIDDKDIKAIVFRIVSPGGSPTASETIRHAVEKAIAKGKPVIVSMGTMAGSGGYWIATDATRIFALPATLTGSIGVVSGKMDASELMKKLSINWDGVQIGKNADMGSMTKSFSPAETERMNAMVDSIYNGFIVRVAKGRKLSPEAVEKIAKGRVWTGHQALSFGLVDELGGLDTALDYTAKLVGAGDRTKIEIVDLPLSKSPIDEVLKMLNIKVAMNRIAGVFIKTLGRQVEQAGLPHTSTYDAFLTKKL